MENTHKSYLHDQILEDLQRKMVFIAGARQTGKTSLALRIASKKNYLNWDIDADREKILKRQWPSGGKILALDEIHKYKNWRNLLKGLYDDWKKEKPILVTGSAKLDYYRRGGDSLQGRYHLLRMHPLSVTELKISKESEWKSLLLLGGFPEPFFSQSETQTKRWRREYRARLIKEEISSLENIQDYGNMELLSIRLPELVASPLSINSLREDLQTSHRTVAHYLDILERLYFIFRISPFGAPKIRAVKKEQKHYHLDWGLIEDSAKRFENLVACHLLKWVNWEEDVKGEDMELRYFRDIDGREVDFVILKNRKPILCVECKWDDRDIDPSLNYFKKKFPEVEAWQVSAVGKKDYEATNGIRVSPARTFLQRFI
jgi:predicted AAA+ superfamily ATPase